MKLLLVYRLILRTLAKVFLRLQRYIGNSCFASRLSSVVHIICIIWIMASLFSVFFSGYSISELVHAMLFSLVLSMKVKIECANSFLWCFCSRNFFWKYFSNHSAGVSLWKFCNCLSMYTWAMLSLLVVRCSNCLYTFQKNSSLPWSKKCNCY